jgi:hypothetical protein
LAVNLFQFLVFTGVFALPVITLKATSRAIYKKEAEEAECQFSSDGKRVETSRAAIRRP